MRCAHVLAVLLLMALPVSRGWSVMDQYYRIGTRLWGFSSSGVTEPFVHDPPRGGMCTGGLLRDLDRVREAMPSLFAAGTGAPQSKVSVPCAVECASRAALYRNVRHPVVHRVAWSSSRLEVA
jgi:hypothetical protein